MMRRQHISSVRPMTKAMLTYFPVPHIACCSLIFGCMGFAANVQAQSPSQRQIYTETYTYDAANRLTRVTYDADHQLAYTYDATSNPLSRSLTRIDQTSTEGDELPLVHALHANYPNPFNPTTVVAYQVPEAVQVRLDIFNVLGQRVYTLVNAEQAPGRYEVVWNGRDDARQTVASGVYLYRMQAGTFVETRTMLLVK